MAEWYQIIMASLTGASVFATVIIGLVAAYKENKRHKESMEQLGVQHLDRVILFGNEGLKPYELGRLKETITWGFNFNK